MKRISLFSAVAVACALGSAHAADNANDTRNNTSGSDTGLGGTQSAAGAGSDQGQANVPSNESANNPSGTQAAGSSGTRSSGANNPDQAMAKAKVGPQAVAVQTSLMDAINEVKGLRALMDVNRSSQQAGQAQQGEAMSQSSSPDGLKMHMRKLQSEVRSAERAQDSIQSRIQSIPSIAQTSDFHSVQSAFNDLKGLSNAWQAKASQSNYWTNSDQVKSDLDNLEKRLKTALDKSQSFSSSQLNISSVG